MTIKGLRASQRLPVNALFSLLLILVLTGCSSSVNILAPDTVPIQNSIFNGQSSNIGIQCPPFNPNNTICTAQYTPVCVKSQNGSTVSYRTASNACSACATSEAISYVEGECS